MRVLAWIPLAGIAVCCCTCGPHQSACLSPYASESPGQQVEIGTYVVRLQRESDAPGIVCEILQRGHCVRRWAGHSFQVGATSWGGPCPEPVMGRDITGDGVPDLVIAEWTGGAHCRFLFHVFGLGSQLCDLGTLDAGHADLAGFEDLDSDGRLEFVTPDWSFAYWRTSFAGSPAPLVILAPGEHGYHVATELMRQSCPSEADLIRLAEETRDRPGWDGGQPPPVLWAAMLDLIYSGNVGSAWKLVEDAWPSGLPGRPEFTQAFKDQLSTSPYWTEICAMGSG